MSEENKNIVEKYDDLPKNAEAGDKYTVREDAIVYEFQDDGSWKDVDIDEETDQQNEEQAQADADASASSTEEQPAASEETQPEDAQSTDPVEESTPAEDTPADSDKPADEKEGDHANTAEPENETASEDQADEAGQPADPADSTDPEPESDDGVKTQDSKEQADAPEGVDPEQAQPENQPLAVAEVEQPYAGQEAVPVDPNAEQSTPAARPDEKIAQAEEENAQAEDVARDQIADAGADAQAATTAEPTEAGKAADEANKQAEEEGQATDGQQPNNGAADDVAEGKPNNDQTYTEDQTADNTPAPEIVQQQENHTAEPDPVVSQEETAVQNATDPDQPTVIPQEAKSESLAHQPADPTQETVFVKQDENLDPEVRVIQQRIEEYIANMGVNGKHDRRDGAKHQARLYKDLHSIMSLEPTKFKQAMDYLLNRVYEERSGAFSDTYTRRYFDQLSPSHLQTDRVREFDNILSLITTVGHSKNRARSLEHIDLQRALKNIQDAGKQQRMAAYFDALR